MKKWMNCCTIVLLVGMATVVAIVANINRPEPVGAEDAFEALTYSDPEGCYFVVYDNAWRCRNGEVRAEYYFAWAAPSGMIIAEEDPESWRMLRIREEEAVLFGEDKYPKRKIFLKDGIWLMERQRSIHGSMTTRLPLFYLTQAGQLSKLFRHWADSGGSIR